MPPVRSRISLKDVAREASVSVNTASKVLNETRSSTHVSDETRMRILATASRLGYQPNSAARSLVRRRSDIVAFFLDRDIRMSEPFTAALVEGAERGCAEKHQSLLLISRGREDTDEAAARHLLSGIADGVVLASWARSGVVDKLLDSHLPVVQYPFRPERDIPSVAIDQAVGALQAMDYLASRGHRRILYRSHAWVGESRKRCFEQAAIQCGVDLIVVTPPAEGTVSEEERALLERHNSSRPTAVACWNDEYAYRMLDYCDEAGLRVPEDLAVVGFDGLRTFPRMRRKLTTVFVPWSDVARTAASVLIDICSGIDVPRETLLPVELRAGDTA